MNHKMLRRTEVEELRELTNSNGLSMKRGALDKLLVDWLEIEEGLWQLYDFVCAKGLKDSDPRAKAAYAILENTRRPRTTVTACPNCRFPTVLMGLEENQ